MIAIRTATIADAKALAELRWQFRSTQNTAVEAHDPFIRRCVAWMRRELQESSDWKAWVAVQDHAIVGQVWLRTIRKIPNPVAEHEQLAYLSNLFVKPSSRGGTGTRLLEAVLESCRENRIDRIVLWPSRRSVTLYLNHGFVRDGDVMELKL
jgi:N-acetylglutamate synthase-like GNAT family acetyltransferase